MEIQKALFLNIENRDRSCSLHGGSKCKQINPMPKKHNPSLPLNCTGG